MHQRALNISMDDPNSPTANNNSEKVSVAESDPRPPLSSRKRHKKLVRLLTVMAYVFSVSLGAIVLSLYYVFLWDPQIHREGRRLNPPPLPDYDYLRAPPDNGSSSWVGTTPPEASTVTTAA